MTKRPFRALIVLLLLAVILSPTVAMARVGILPVAPHIQGKRDIIPRIQCPTGYSARVYAQGLSSPDGLAFSSAGTLYVAEEGADRVSRIESDGSLTTVISGLANPEGIAFDNGDNIYVVEDVEGGRLLKVAPDGAPTTLAAALDAPEGVVWTSDGTVYVTESNVQFTPNSLDYVTHVTAVSSLGAATQVLTNPWLWSYAGIATGPNGLLYVTNEASGTGTHDSIFVVDPTTGTRTLFASNFIAPEGLRFSSDGQFPLFVVQEDTGSGLGMLSRVEANGSHTPFCTGFISIEDVIQDDDGRVYVSEDSTGLVIVIEPGTPQRSDAQAIILFVGNGMGEAHRSAGRWSAEGQSGALAMDRMPVVGWSRTGSADDPITDSAAASTALATGTKTNNGVIGQDPQGNDLTTILERAQARGMAVGLVTTVQMSHATPAAFAAHVDDQNKMTEIASQMVLTTKVDVLLGGGEDEFLPEDINGCYPESGERTDGSNLITEAQAAGYTYVCDTIGFNTVDPASTTRLLGLFADEGMARPFSPSLAAMTQTAIDILSQDPDGFFLMVEAGQIDWAGRDNDATNVISDTIGLDDAVAVAQAYAATAENTLIIATADHETGGMTVALTPSGLPECPTPPDAANPPCAEGPFTMPEGTPFFANWDTTLHTAADVPSTAQGPWSDLLSGVHENTRVHFVMHMALEGPGKIYLPIICKYLPVVCKEIAGRENIPRA